MSTLTTSKIGEWTLIGDTYFKHVNASFSHIGNGDKIVFKDCDGNYAELYHDEDGDWIATVSDLGQEDLDILTDGRLLCCTMSKDAVKHLAGLGYNTEFLPLAIAPENVAILPAKFGHYQIVNSQGERLNDYDFKYSDDAITWASQEGMSVDYTY